MKKFLFLILICAAGYFAYEYLIKEKPALEINAYKSTSTNYSMNENAPALAPANYGSIQGTVKNISGKVVTNIILKYKLNTEPVEARIDRLNPGEVKNFTTQSVRLRHAEVTFYLEETIYN